MKDPNIGDIYKRSHVSNGWWVISISSHCFGLTLVPSNRYNLGYRLVHFPIYWRKFLGAKSDLIEPF